MLSFLRTADTLGVSRRDGTDLRSISRPADVAARGSVCLG